MITEETLLQKAIKLLGEKNYPKAEEQIKLAMLENPHSAQVHNLYGVLEELAMNDDLARRHYRAAYALNPAYKPAADNLERISSFDYRLKADPISYGDKPEEIIKSPYVIQYDDHHIGHFSKKELE